MLLNAIDLLAARTLQQVKGLTQSEARLGQIVQQLQSLQCKEPVGERKLGMKSSNSRILFMF